MSDASQITLIYDQECPVCAAYCKALALRNLDPNFEIVNARSDHPDVDEVKRLGLDLDEGFVLRVGKTYFHGAEAIHRLALLTTRVGRFNRLNYLIFKSERLATLLYPILRSGRNLLLFLLGRRKINA